MDAVILAGQLNHGKLREMNAAEWEAEIPLSGRAMVDYVVDALLEAPSIHRIVVVGPAQARERVEVVAPGDSLWDNLRRGLDALPDDGAILVATADIPLLTGAAVEAFIQAAQPGLDVAYSVVPKSVCERHFPGTRRTYVRLREGVYTGGNLFIVKPRVFFKIRELGETLTANRKAPLKLARHIGWGFLVQFLLGRLSFQDVARRIEEMVDIKGAAVVVPYAEIGVDVDKPEDLQLALARLSSRTAMAKDWER